MCSNGLLADDDVDLHALSDGALLEQVAELAALQNRIAARLTRVVRVADARQACEHDALKSMRSWLAGHTGTTPAAAGALVRDGRALDHLPATAAAFATGAISADHVAVIAPIATPVNLTKATDQGIDLTVIDTALAAIATTQPVKKLAEAVHTYLAMLDPDGTEPDPVDQRALTIATHADGSVTIRGELDAVGGERVKAVLEPIAATSRTADDDRTAAQIRADALVQWADNTLAGGDVPLQRGRKPQIGALVPLSDLTDQATGHGTAELNYGAQLSAARTRWLACDSEIARIVMGPDGIPLDIGATQRLVKPHVRKYLDLRDQGCVFTGCNAPTWWCEAHHLLHWAFGGETVPDNLALLCERHHGKIHAGYDVIPQPDGTWRTLRPDGTQIRVARTALVAAR